MVLFLMACKAPAPTGSTFDPTSVGLAYDGIVRSDGTLSGYQSGGASYDPTMVLVFAGERFFTASDSAVRDANSCVAFGSVGAPPQVPPDQIDTWDDSTLFWSYDFPLVLEQTSCIGRVDPGRWGEDAGQLLDAFQDAHLGFGIGPLTEGLRDSWSERTLAERGGSMVAEWFALDDAQGDWVAADWTTGFAYAVEPQTGDLLVQDGAFVPVDLTGLAPGDPIPAFYVASYPSWYQDFSLLWIGR